MLNKWIWIIGVTAVGWYFIGFWALFAGVMIAVWSGALLPGTQKMMAEERQRKINARKMRREIQITNRNGLAQMYVERHPDRA